MGVLSSAGSILLIIFGFGVLIFVHELGHFLAAKWAGIRTEGFAVGMGPVVVSWRKGLGTTLGSSDRRVRALAGKPPAELTDAELARHGLGETEYSLRWLPIGGFVKMLGQEDLKAIEETADPRSYTACPIGKRMVVVSAGVIMNVLLAMVLFVIAFLVGVRFDAPVVGDVRAGSPAGTTVATNAAGLGVSEPGLRPGDMVLAIDGGPARTFNDVQIASAMSKPGVPLELTIERAGVPEPLVFPILASVDPASGLLSIGVAPARSARLYAGDQAGDVDAILGEVGLGDTGLRAGMEMISAAGQPISTHGEFARVADASGGAPVTTEWVTRSDDGTVSAPVVVDVPVRPDYALMVQPATGGDGLVFDDLGLLGLSPLTEISYVGEDSPNRSVLRPHDVVLRAGSTDYPRFSQFKAAARSRAGGTLDLVLLRDGERTEVSTEVSREGRLGVTIGWVEAIPRTADVVTRVVDTSEGADAEAPTAVADLGLLPGTGFTAVDGQPVAGWRELRDVLRGRTSGALADESGATVRLSIVHPTPGGEAEDVELVLSPADVADLHRLGYATDLRGALFEPVHTVLSAGGNPIRAMAMGIGETHKMIVMTYLTIDRLFRGSVGVKQLHGPVGIIDLGSKILPRGFMYFLFFLGIISVNLAVINFLPLPIVDGGLFLFLVYEKIKGRPPSVRFQNAATVVGLCLIGTVFLVTFYNDIMRLL
jgi:regulator of sigma E protease